MAEAYTFAHFTDPHLPLLPQDLGLRALLPGKRLSGIMSWQGNRRYIHLPEILAALVGDIHAHQPRHIVLTGDLVNISLAREFDRAAAWLRGVGPPADVSVVPGNHDCYVADEGAAGQIQWAPYMRGDAPGGVDFPYCRIRGDMAFIGVTTAVATPVFCADGEVGAAQLAALENMLQRLGRDGLMRVVMLHHPPGAAGIARRKGLRDRDALLQVLARCGAELVLHGHTHRGVLDRIPGPRGPIPVVAPSSASALGSHGENARWHFLEVSRKDGGWQVAVTVRGLDPQTRQFRTDGQFTLSV